MSYDLCFFRPVPGASFDAILDEMEARADAPDAAPPRSYRLWTDSERSQIADVLLRLDPSLEVCNDEESIELSSPGEPPFQWSLFADEIVLNWPYFGGEDAARQLLARVRAAVEALVSMGGCLFDPQLGRPVELDRDEGEIVAAYVRVDTLQLSDFTRITVSDGSASKRRKPWWKFW